MGTHSLETKIFINDNLLDFLSNLDCLLFKIFGWHRLCFVRIGVEDCVGPFD
jgi:hypothetical protein